MIDHDEDCIERCPFDAAGEKCRIMHGCALCSSRSEPTYDESSEYFDTQIEADAFVAGLTYGDEPQYVFIRFEEHGRKVIFRDKYADPY